MFGIDDLILGGLAAGGSLLGGLGARQSAKSANRHQAEQDKLARERAMTNFEHWRHDTPKWLIQDAETAGFNPVTWLNAGALGHYDNMFGAFGGVVGQSTQVRAVPSVMSAVGDAIGSFGSALGTSYRANQKIAVEREALGAIGGGSLASHPYADKIGYSSGLGGTDGPLYGTKSVGGVGGLSLQSGPGRSPSGKSSVTEPWAKVGYGSDPYSPDAATVSDRSGDLFEEVAGGYNQFIADPFWNATGVSLTKLAADAGKAAVKMLPGTAPTATDLMDVWNHPSKAWGFVTRNVPDYGKYFRNPGAMPELGYPSP